MASTKAVSRNGSANGIGHPSVGMPKLGKPGLDKATPDKATPDKPTPEKPTLVKPTSVKPRINPEYACFGMRLARSKIHRWGVFATESMPSGRKVLEYTGERINRIETKRRADAREFTYLFTLDPYWTIDGAVGGSGAEYINHSCEPNLISRILKGHILYFTLRDIKPGEELTIDYRFDKKVERVSCLCGAQKCRGTINLLK